MTKKIYMPSIGYTKGFPMSLFTEKLECISKTFHSTIVEDWVQYKRKLSLKATTNASYHTELGL